MAKSCVFKPHNKHGEELLAKLEADLGHNKAAFIYNRVITDEFIDSFKDRLVLNDNIPTYESLMKLQIITDYIGEDTIIENINKKQPHLEDTANNTSLLIKQANKFNNNEENSKYIAFVDYDTEGKLTLHVVPRTDSSIETANNQYKIQQLNEKIAEILTPIGIGIGYLSAEEVAVGRVGVTDFNRAVEAAEGFATMMSIANNMEGHRAISEEFSHLLIGVYRDKPLVSRSITALKDEALARQVLGDDYDDVSEYYNGDTEKIAEEALGHILRDTLLDNYTSANIERSKVKSASLFRRFLNYIINLFKGYNPAYIHSTISEIRDGVDGMVYEIMNNEKTLSKEDIAKAQRKAKFNALSEKMERQKKVLNDIDERQYKDIVFQQDLKEGVAYSKRASNLATNTHKIFRENIKKGETLAAINSFIGMATKNLEKYHSELVDIESLNVRDRFVLLRNVEFLLQKNSLDIKDLKDITENTFLTDEDIASQKFVVEDTDNSLAEFENFEDEDEDKVDTAGMTPQEIAERIMKDSEEWELSENEEYYQHKTTKKKGVRVTRIVHSGKGEQGFSKDSPWYRPSTNIGTGVDEFIRDFLSGRIEKVGDEYLINGKKLDEVYPNATHEALNKLAHSLQEFKEEQAAKGITLLSRDVVADGTITVLDDTGRPHKINVVGTLDLLGYDNKGQWYVYDIKTFRSEIDEEKKGKYEQQITLYRDLLEQKYGIRVRDMAIVPVKVSYPTPKGAKDRHGEGKASYIVSKDKPADYLGKKSNQLKLDGKEYRGANPTREETIPTSQRKTNASYEDLGGKTTENPVKAMLLALSTLDRLYSQLGNLYREVLPKHLSRYFKDLVGDNMQVREYDENGKFTGRMKTVSIDTIIQKSDRDTSLAQKWLTTMADNPDPFMQILSKIYTDAKHRKRALMIEKSQQILALGKKYEKQGIRDYDWMFEDDKQRYIMHYEVNGRDYSYDRSAYEKAKADYIKELNDVYGEYPEIGSEKWKQKQAALEKWLSKNLVVIDLKTGNQKKKEKYEEDNTQTIPSPTIYPSRYKDLTDTQKAFYDEWIEIKQELDGLLPSDATFTTNTIKIRKTGYQRLMDITKGNAIHDFVERVKADYLQSYDDEFTYNKGIKTYTGERFMKLPIFYVHAKDASDVTTDVIGSLIAYADMAYNYDAMSDIVNPLEIAKVAARERKVSKVMNNRNVYEEFSFGDRRVKNQLYEGANSNFLELLDMFLEDKLYGKTMKDYGYWEVGDKKFDKNKIANKILQIGSTVQLGFNPLAGTANLVTGLQMQKIEAFAGEFYTARELASADASFIAEQAEYVLDLGRRIKMGKLALVEQYMDFRQDWSKNIRKEDFKNRQWILRLIGPTTKYICQDAGDHWLYDRAGIAMMKRYKLKDGDNEISLWDALEVVPIDKDNPDFGNKLVLKEGVTKLDGTEFTDADRIALTDRIHYVNKHCFGVYDRESSIAARRTILGKFVMQYRDWIPAQFRYRYGSMTTNLEKGDIVEGYYRTVGRILAREWKNGNHSLSQILDSMTAYEKANVKRCGRELANLVALYIIVAIIKGMFKDKDKKKLSWIQKALLYMGQREKTELGALTPITGWGEMITIMKSPAANTSVVSDIYNLRLCLNPINYTDEIKSGDFKGHSSAYRAFMRSPLTVYYRTLKRTINIENTQYYKNNK